MAKRPKAFPTPNGKQFSLYNGGELNEILTQDLVNNEVAIKQLINDYNLKSKEINELRGRETDLKTELDYQKTSPFFAIISAICNILGTIIVGLGINLSSKKVGLSLVVIGGILIFISNVQTICHRWVRQWFASSKTEKKSVRSQSYKSINDSLT